MALLVHLADEVPQHDLGDLEVGDDAVLHGPDGDDVARRAAEHALGLHADCKHTTVVLVDGHDGGLIEHDAAPTHVHKGVRGSEIDRHVATEERGVEVRHRNPSAWEQRPILPADRIAR
jgi:hypothetical protein